MNQEQGLLQNDDKVLVFACHNIVYLFPDMDALGEYTGVKPDEFLTLDKHEMERSGQIMYDTPTSTMRAGGNSCSTLDRLGGRGRPSPTAARLIPNNRNNSPIDYDTGNETYGGEACLVQPLLHLVLRFPNYQW